MLNERVAPPQASSVPILNGWKEIATYLNRGVRTVQRWEREMGLPTRRPRGRGRSAVIAIPEELDAWARHALANDGAPAPAETAVATGQVESAWEEVRRLSRQVRSEHHAAVETLHDRLKEIMERVALSRERVA